MEFKEEKPAQCFDERRESDSNRRVAVLQTAVLTTSPPRQIPCGIWLPGIVLYLAPLPTGSLDSTIAVRLEQIQIHKKTILADG